MTSFTGSSQDILYTPARAQRARETTSGWLGGQWELREQRVRFVVAAHRREKSMAELCREFRHFASSGIRVAATIRRRRSGSHCRAQPAAAAQSAAETGGDRTAGDRAAASLSRLGCAQAARLAAGARGGHWRATRFIASCCDMGWCILAGGPPRQLNSQRKLHEGGPSRLFLAGWGFSLVERRCSDRTKAPPGQHQPGWATHFTSSRNHRHRPASTRGDSLTPCLGDLSVFSNPSVSTSSPSLVTGGNPSSTQPGRWPRYQIRAPRSALFWPNVGALTPAGMLGSPVTDALDLRLCSFPMPKGLCRIQHTGLSHFITFSCYRRQQFFNNRHVYDLFPICLERMRPVAQVSNPWPVAQVSNPCPTFGPLLA